MKGMAVANGLSVNASCLSAPYCMGWSNHFDSVSVGGELSYSAKLHPEKVALGSISSVAALCHTLSITQEEIDAALALPLEQRYVAKKVPKKDGSERVVNNPHHLIRKIQRRINSRIFANRAMIRWPDHVYGSVPNDKNANNPIAKKDYVNCARRHCGAKSILSLDIKDFFDNIHRDLVYSIFREFLKYPEDVSEVLVDICCKGPSVVQGALTSSYIATLCLHKVEGDVVKKLMYKNLVYTRLVDDITVSSKVFSYDFGYAVRCIEEMLLAAGLPVNVGKTKLQLASVKPMLVHGLRVDFDEPRLPPDEPKKIRASVKNLELLAASPGYRASRAYRKDFNRCMGRVNKLHRVGHTQHKQLIDRLKKILPLPSHKDIERAERLIHRLVSDSQKPGYKQTFWFYKRYHVAIERLSVLRRSFPNKANELKVKLDSVRPKRYE